MLCSGGVKNPIALMVVGLLFLEFPAELMAKAGNVFEGVDVVGSTPPQFWNKDHYLDP